MNKFVTIVFQKKREWLLKVINEEADERGERERNNLILEILEEKYIDKKPVKLKKDVETSLCC